MTLAAPDAYEGLAALQTGAVVNAKDDSILSGQFEVQNATKVDAAPATEAVT